MSVKHATFVIERTYEAVPEKVFQAWADPKKKAHWFVGPESWEQSDYVLDFRVGGTEHISGGPEGGPVHSYDAVYQDIVPNERIVTTYQMRADDQRTSVSVATIELHAEGPGTRLVLTEQGAFFDELDQPEYREHGTNDLLDQLAKFLG